ncbi:hypothetical protein BsWGS_22400 [Bradybaena similaris]
MASSSTVVMLALGSCLLVLGVHASSAAFQSLRPRVIGGTEIRDMCRSPFSSVVALQFDAPAGSVTFCSAVMLTESILVTSGFCAWRIQELEDLPYYAVVGERDLQMTDFDEQKISVAAIRIHSGFNVSTFDNNIALLRLSKPATLSSCVKPAFKMETDPTACSDFDQSCMVVGWGPFVENNRPTNSRLPRYASVTVLGDNVAKLLTPLDVNKPNLPVGSTFAETVNRNIKTCFFDWGGMISCRRNGNHVLRGLVGEHNCNSNVPLPILVTDVPYFQKWLDLCLLDWNRCTSL